MTRAEYEKQQARHLGKVAIQHLTRGDGELGALTARLAAHHAEEAMYLEWIATDPQDGLFGGPLEPHMLRPVWEAMQNPGSIIRSQAGPDLTQR